MKISRTGSCPAFLDYVTRRALIPRATEPTPEFLRLTEYNFCWIDIPSYQRGLVWDDELFEELLNSESVFLGNAVLGAFETPKGGNGFERLPPDVTEYEILIDGLQRFSIGTALLRILHPMVLADEPGRPDDAPHFSALKAQCASLSPIYFHNDRELAEHPRKAVRESYRRFREMLLRWIESELNRNDGQKLARKLTRLFLARQVAPDTYHGFSNPYAVTNTFIGLNTVRVQLNIIDWLRSIIVDQGSSSDWEPASTEELENRFTEVFTRDGGNPHRELIPLAAIIKDGLTSSDTSKPLKIFPTWTSESRPSLAIDEVHVFLNFVEQLFHFQDNPLIREIRLCGAIPFAGLLCHYYRILLESKARPSFFEGGVLEDAELLAYLRGYYRVVFDGHVARTRSVAEQLLFTETTLADAADQISRDYLGRKLDALVDGDWLVAMLKQTDQKRSMRVFNACHLPPHGEPVSFAPDTYGRKGKDQCQVDHLIPDSETESNLPGGPETQLIMNFAPIRRTVNNKQSNLACSAKLGAGGSYANEVANNPDVHPYVAWLVANQARHANFLDQQARLQPNSEPPIADERIRWIADRLLNRL